MLASMISFGCMSVVIRLLAGEMPSTLMVFLRNAMSVLLILAWSAGMQRRLPRFPTVRVRGHFWRAAVGLCAMELWFYSLSIMPLSPATAISFMTPIFSTIFAVLYLHEKAGVARWAAIFAGFLGVLVILRPDTQALSAGALIVLLSSALMGLAGVLVKSLTRTESPETIVYYMSIFMLILSVPPALLHWQPVTPYQLWLALVIAALSTGAHLLLTRAYVRADMVVLMPFDFVRLVVVAILANLLFGEVLTTSTMIGALIIVAAAVFAARREVRISSGPPTSCG